MDELKVKDRVKLIIESADVFVPLNSEGVVEDVDGKPNIITVDFYECMQDVKRKHLKKIK